MKYLWLIEVNWDKPIPKKATTAWKKYHQELPVLSTLKIPRLVTYRLGTRPSYDLVTAQKQRSQLSCIYEYV